MPYEVDETGDLTRTAAVTVAAKAYQKQVNQTLQEMSKNVDIRGFRKGNVPLNVMKKRYGARVQQEVVEDVVRDQLDTILADSDQPVIHVGQPEVTSTPNDTGDNLEFSVDFELRPDIDPIGYLGLELERAKTEVSSEDIDERLEAMRHQYATVEPITFRESIQDGDVVTIDYQAVGDDDNETLAQINGENAQIKVGEGRSIPGLDEGLIGESFDATTTIEVDADEGFPVEELRGDTFEMKIDVKAVKKEVLPELDDEFAKDTDEAETMLELRANLRDQIDQERQQEAIQASEGQLMETLLAQNNFELPPQFVQAQVDRERQQRVQMLEQFTEQGMDPEALGIDPDEFTGGDQLRDEVDERVRTDFLLMAIAEKEGIEPDQEDLMAYIQQQARQSQMQPQQFMAQMMQDEEQLRQANMMALLNKTKAFLLDNADFDEVEPAADDAGAQQADADADQADDADTDADENDKQ